MNQLYREHILDHFHNPRHRGQLQGATHSYEAWNPLCGDKLIFDIMVQDGQLKGIAYEGEGCAISLAAASILSEEIIGRSVEEVKKLIKKVNAPTRN